MFGMMGCGPWGHPGMMYEMQRYGKEELVKCLLYKMAQSGDSDKKVEKNVRTALIYADKVSEEMRRREKLANLKDELQQTEGALKNAEENLEVAKKNLVQYQKEYKQAKKTGNPQMFNENSQAWYRLENGKRRVPEYEKALDDKQKRLVMVRKAATEAGLKV